MDARKRLRCSDGLWQGAPEKRLVDEDVPSVKKRETETEPLGPSGERGHVELDLLIGYHHEGRFPHIHVDAFFAENLHVRNRNGLVAHLNGLLPHIRRVGGTHADIAGIFTRRIVDPTTLDARTSGKHVEQSRDDRLRTPAAFGIFTHKITDRDRELLRSDCHAAVVAGIARLMTGTDGDEGAQRGARQGFVGKFLEFLHEF